MKALKKLIAPALIGALALSLGGCFDISIRVKGTDDPAALLGQSGAVIAPGSSENQTVASETLPEYTTAEPVSSFAPAGQSSEITTAAQSIPQTGSKTPDTLDNEALVDYFNTALNGIKTGKPGFKKTKQTAVSNIQLSNSAAGSVSTAINTTLAPGSAETVKVAKGSDCVNTVSPCGETYVSRIYISDVDSITCDKNGSNYVITANVLAQNNPEKSTGVMSDIFDFVCAENIESVWAPKIGATAQRDDCYTEYSGCYAKLTVSPSGYIVGYETFVKGSVSVKNLSLKKSVTVMTDLTLDYESRTVYSDFSY